MKRIDFKYYVKIEAFKIVLFVVSLLFIIINLQVRYKINNNQYMIEEIIPTNNEKNSLYCQLYSPALGMCDWMIFHFSFKLWFQKFLFSLISEGNFHIDVDNTPSKSEIEQSASYLNYGIWMNG